MESDCDDLLSRYDERSILENYYRARDLLFKSDSFLLEHHANERSVSHKLAEYLQKLFPEWNVDCEYNLNQYRDLPKQLDGIKECDERKKTDRVLPDIIVHIRGLKCNLLVVEIKTGIQDDRCDIIKLKKFTDKEGDYAYKLGVFTSFDGLSKPEVRIFRNGKRVSLPSFF